MIGDFVGAVDFIHPYGRGFMIYTDKEWEHGKVKLESDFITIFNGSYVKIPFDFIISIDKSITLPAIREGRALLLIEYMDVKRRENVYLLLSSAESFMRKLRLGILERITSKTRIMFNFEGKWYSGRMVVGDSCVSFISSITLRIEIPWIVGVSRKKMEYGFKKIGVIYIEYDDGHLKRNVMVFVNPVKRMFFWKLMNQLVEDYINTSIMSNIKNVEKMILHLISKGWSYGDIMAKLELTKDEMERIVNNLEKYGVIRKIVVLKLTDRGKKVLDEITVLDLQ